MTIWKVLAFAGVEWDLDVDFSHFAFVNGRSCPVTQFKTECISSTLF